MEIYFNMRTRKSEPLTGDVRERFEKFLVSLEQKDFQSRVNYLRTQNKLNRP